MSLATALTRAERGLLSFIAMASLSVASAGTLEAQGVTSGAVRGRVTDQAGAGIGGATVVLTNRETGARSQTSTADGGAFYLANVIIGNYAIEARAIGYRPGGRSDLIVRLGQTADVGALVLEPSPVEVTEITVTGQAENDLLSRGRTGVSALITEHLIQNLPSLNRNFGDFTRTSALVNGRSIAGQADRFNSLQIDGGNNSDLFGLNSSGGSPGGRNSSRPLSVEAIREFQVLIAPFDVRQGGFTGGLVNAVTKSGTNQFHGSIFGFYQDNGLQGDDTANVAAPEFDRRYYGFSLSGPIVRDRFHFFLSTEWRAEEEPFNGSSFGVVRNITDADTINFSPTAGLSARTAERIRQHAINNLGFDPGDWRRPQIPNPDRNLFLKLSGQLGTRHQVELAFNTVKSSLAVLTHAPTDANPTRLREGYQFSRSGYDNDHSNRSIRARLNSQLSNRLTNEAMISLYRLEDVRSLPTRRSLMIVSADSTGHHFALGAERFSHLNVLEQDVFELSNNLTYSVGSHVLTLGGRLERFDFYNAFFPASLGAWYFPDTTAFFAGTPNRYERALPGNVANPTLGRADGPIADFRFNQFGLYAQDQIRVTPTFTLTLGVRADFTGLPAPAYNPLVDTMQILIGPGHGEPLGVRTDSRPTNALLISPRLGFNIDVSGNQATFIRGGIGVFSGRAPYVWASNAYTNTGLEQVQLTCTGAGVPAFATHPDSQYTACVGGTALAVPRPAIVFFDENFKLPQSLRLALGADQRLPWEVVGTVDLMYTKALNQFLLTDINLVEGGRSMGEGARSLYAFNTGNTLTQCRAMGANGAVCGGAARPSAAGWVLPFDVLKQYNSSRDYSYSASFSLTKRFSDNFEFSAQYAYARSYDLMSPTSDISNSLLNFATLDGTLADRNLRPSFFDQPHSIRLSGAADGPFGLRFSLSYSGASGRPYAYRYNTDVNGDGFSGNDLFYVPTGPQDISLVNVTGQTLSQAELWNRLNTFIDGEKCLREHRGQIMQRNSCRNPWQAFVDARIAKTIQTVRGQSVELTANIFNVLALLGVGGDNRVTSSNENLPLLTRTSYSTALSRGVYSLLLPARRSLQYPASRWKLEFGARYAF